ncbi:MAG: DUF4388 domain-containing protein [Acidobacteriota bacterium]
MKDYIYEGDISETPLPEVLQKINYYKVPGVLTVKNSKGAKEIFISGGEVIFASSTFEDDRLGEFLLARKKITQADYDKSVEILKKTGKRQGKIFIELGVLTPSELLELVKEQVMAIIWSLFEWTEGSITFKVGKFKDDEVIKLNLDTRLVILEGIKRISDPKRVVKWLGKKDDVFEPSENALALLPTLPLSLDEKRIFRFVDGRRTFLMLLEVSPIDSGKTAKILYALYILGLIKKRESGIKIKAGL